MSDLSCDLQKNQTVAALEKKKNISGLIQLLKSRDPDIQSQAQRALVELGDDA